MRFYLTAVLCIFLLISVSCGGGSSSEPASIGDSAERTVSTGSESWAQLGGDKYNTHSVLNGIPSIDTSDDIECDTGIVGQPIQSSVVFFKDQKAYVTTTDGDLYCSSYANDNWGWGIPLFSPGTSNTTCYSTPAINDVDDTPCLYYEHDGNLYGFSVGSSGSISALTPNSYGVGHLDGASPSVMYHDGALFWDAVFAGSPSFVTRWEDTPPSWPNPMGFSCYKSAYEPEGVDGGTPEAIIWDVSTNTLNTWRTWLPGYYQAGSSPLPGDVPFMAHPLEIYPFALYNPGDIILATTTDLLWLQQGLSWGIHTGYSLPKGEQYVSSCAFAPDSVLDEPTIFVVREALAEWSDPSNPFGGIGGGGTMQMCGFVDCYTAVEVTPGVHEWELQWYGVMDSASPSTPAVCSDGIVYAASKTGFYIFEENGTVPTGEPMRRMPSYSAAGLGTNITSSPQVAYDGSVWLGSNTGYVYKFYND